MGLGLEFERLSKHVQHGEAGSDRRLLFHDISGSVHSGETIVLLGASGKGKSTLLRMLALLEQIQWRLCVTSS